MSTKLKRRVKVANRTMKWMLSKVQARRVMARSSVPHHMQISPCQQDLCSINPVYICRSRSRMIVFARLFSDHVVDCGVGMKERLRGDLSRSSVSDIQVQFIRIRWSSSAELRSYNNQVSIATPTAPASSTTYLCIRDSNQVDGRRTRISVLISSK